MGSRTGLAIVGGSAALLAVLALLFLDGPWRAHTQIHVDIDGAAADEGGVLEVGAGFSDLRLSCAGACDDIVLEFEGSPNSLVLTRASAGLGQTPGRMKTYAVEQGRLHIDGATAEFESGPLGRLLDRAFGHFPEMAVKRRRGYTRLHVDGGAVSRAGGVILRLKADALSYSQRCVGGCDTLLIDFPAFGESVYDLRVEGAAGRVVFDGGEYVDGHMSSRLEAEPGGRLRLDTKLAAY